MLWMLCRSIVAYCQRYDNTERKAAQAGHIAGHPGLLATQEQQLMPAGDAVLFIAYLDLFRCGGCVCVPLSSDATAVLIAKFGADCVGGDVNGLLPFRHECHCTHAS
jgi:hypothetical protein